MMSLFNPAKTAGSLGMASSNTITDTTMWTKSAKNTTATTVTNASKTSTTSVNEADYILAYVTPADYGHGSVPNNSVRPISQALDSLLSSGSNFFVAGHMLNHHLGGSGKKQDNITAFTKSDNSKHNDMEELAKNEVKANGNNILYETAVTERADINMSNGASIKNLASHLEVTFWIVDNNGDQVSGTSAQTDDFDINIKGAGKPWVAHKTNGTATLAKSTPTGAPILKNISKKRHFPGFYSELIRSICNTHGLDEGEVSNAMDDAGVTTQSQSGGGESWTSYANYKIEMNKHNLSDPKYGKLVTTAFIALENTATHYNAGTGGINASNVVDDARQLIKAWFK
ncbi:hypothetical protein [Chromobacterium violaceum]|uniref:hypothetical protein n=1 Tax=Chromobacterium violaceum TaxID=536 RepID=UPI00111C928A|nr:hypothetical protein [Chromobacterium violaceum]QRO34004.1 hypothetical protein I6K04_04470 [Chromobacterium violaceum]QRQ16193.1 hypothetical protein I6K03_18260 [Chromobacterium violaceum]